MPRERKTAPTTSRALGYCRVSTRKQADLGISLQAQRDAIAEHCRRQGWELVEVFEDAGLSGATLERPALLAMLGAVRRGMKIVVWRLDRMSREVADAIGLELEISKKGAELVTLDSGAIDTSDPTSELLFVLRAALAKFERRMAGARTAFALRQKRARGERIGTIPYGQRLTGDGSDRLEVEPQEQRALLILSELKAAGFSLRQIAEELNRQGFTTRKGTPWRFEYVRSLARKAA